MTPDEYRVAIKTLGLTQSRAGKFFGVNPVTGRRWAKAGPPVAVAKLIRVMLARGLSVDDVNGLQ